MDAEFDTAPIAKKAKGEDTIDIDKCLFCTKSFSSKEQPVAPVLNKLRSLFSACRQRNDSVSQKLLAHESDIISGTVVFRYHRQCRSTYVSQHHIRRAIKTVDNSDVVLDDGGNSSSGNGDGASGGCANRFTRSKASVVKFDWKSRCFICSDPCSSKHRLSWSMVESSVKDDPEHPNMYTRVLQAAKAKQDDDMITRLQGVPNGDLVAIEARYHRQKSCYINYVSGRSITASQNRKQQFAAHSTSVRRLISEFTSPIIEHRQIFFLSTLRKRFLEILAEEGVDHPGSYTSYNLKRQLIKEWPDVGYMYGKTNCMSLNALRCQKTGQRNIQGKKLPPTEDVFSLHLLRSAYQLLIWRQAAYPSPTLPDATAYGFEHSPGGTGLQPQMMSQSPAAPELLNDLVCDCQPNTCAVECSCLESGQPCTASCTCEALVDGGDKSCSNPFTLSAFYSDNSDSDAD